jgi:Tfp pilus assembly protein PilN
VIRINLLPRESHATWRLDFTNAPSLPVCLLLLSTPLVIAWWFWSLHAVSRQLAADVVAIEAETARLQPALEIVRQLEYRRVQLEQRALLVAKLRAGQGSAGPVLEEVARAATEGLWLIELTFKDRQLTIKGGSVSLAEVSHLVANLGTSRLFRQPVEIVDTERKGDDREGEMVTFTVKATVNN